MTNLVQNGADGTLATDDKMFVTFDGNVKGGRYAYDIGLYGVTNTVETFTETLIKASPTATLSGLSGTINGQQTLTVTFSEAVTGLTEGDFTLTNATIVAASLSAGAGNSYTFDIVPISTGSISVTLPALSVVENVYSLGNAPSNTLNATADVTPPDVTISGLPANIVGPTVFNATITFSESVTGFDLGDITIAGGSVSALSGSGADYIATVSATGGADLVMSVAANVAVDAAQNGNTASGTATSTNTTASETENLIAHFMQTRANALLANQPDLAGFLRGGAGQFAAEITRGGGSLNFDSGYNAPVWARVNANWSTDLGAESQYVFGAIGGHAKLSENFLMGGMVQFDHMSEMDGAAEISGNGWLVGPYFAAKLANQPLYFEGSLLYGQTANTVSPLGTYTDNFTTERWLATLGVSGAIERNGLTLLPFLDAKYTSDAQAAYTDSLNNQIAAQTIGLAQVSAGLDFELALNAATTLNGGASGIWSYSNGGATDPGYEGGRARVDLGIEHKFSDCNGLTVSSFYDGIGAANFESYGAEIKWETCF